MSMAYTKTKFIFTIHGIQVGGLVALALVTCSLYSDYLKFSVGIYFHTY